MRPPTASIGRIATFDGGPSSFGEKGRRNHADEHAPERVGLSARLPIGCVLQNEERHDAEAENADDNAKSSMSTRRRSVIDGRFGEHGRDSTRVVVKAASARNGGDRTRGTVPGDIARCHFFSRVVDCSPPHHISMAKYGENHGVTRVSPKTGPNE